jgi:Rod binding domain-containing protein
MIDKISTLPAAASEHARANPLKVEEAARQFESLLIGQILKGMHEAGSAGWLGSGDDPSGESAMELAEEQFAQALAARGGMGLAGLITKGLTGRASENAAKTSTAPEKNPRNAPVVGR